MKYIIIVKYNDVNEAIYLNNTKYLEAETNGCNLLNPKMLIITYQK